MEIDAGDGQRLPDRAGGVTPADDGARDTVCAQDVDDENAELFGDRINVMAGIGACGVDWPSGR